MDHWFSSGRARRCAVFEMVHANIYASARAGGRAILAESGGVGRNAVHGQRAGVAELLGGRSAESGRCGRGERRISSCRGELRRILPAWCGNTGRGGPCGDAGWWAAPARVMVSDGGGGVSSR